LQALEKANIRLEDVKLIVPHQANARIIEAAGKRLGVGADVMVNGIAAYGNTSTASIPLALKDALAAGRLKTGDHLVLVGFGAGLTWGACVSPDPFVKRIRTSRPPMHLVSRIRSRTASGSNKAEPAPASTRRSPGARPPWPDTHW